jgi:hypothetical protein
MMKSPGIQMFLYVMSVQNAFLIGGGGDILDWCKLPLSHLPSHNHTLFGVTVAQKPHALQDGKFDSSKSEEII